MKRMREDMINSFDTALEECDILIANTEDDIIAAEKDIVIILKSVNGEQEELELREVPQQMFNGQNEETDFE